MNPKTVFLRNVNHYLLILSLALFPANTLDKKLIKRNLHHINQLNFYITEIIRNILTGLPLIYQNL